MNTVKKIVADKKKHKHWHNKNKIADIIGMFCIGIPPIVPAILAILYLAPVGFWQCMIGLFFGGFIYCVSLLAWIVLIRILWDV